jgi:Tol biopolymer transport system component
VERGVSQRFTANAESNTFPVWSPDGRTVLFSSGTPRNLFRKDSSGAGNELRVSQSANNQFGMDWSSDGRWVLYSEITSATQRDLWVLPVAPGGAPVPDATPKFYLRTPYNEHVGRFSPEAPPKWVAYQSDETGRYEVYIQSFPEPRGATRISTGGGHYPQWGEGGRELFYVSLDNKLMAVNLKLGVDRVEASPPRELFVLPIAEDGFSPYCADPGGQRFLVRSTPRTAAEPLTVIVNWPALLKKETPAP